MLSVWVKILIAQGVHKIRNENFLRKDIMIKTTHSDLKEFVDAFTIKIKRFKNSVFPKTFFLKIFLAALSSACFRYESQFILEQIRHRSKISLKAFGFISKLSIYFKYSS